jgi:hypothetical protein
VRSSALLQPQNIIVNESALCFDDVNISNNIFLNSILISSLW